MNSQITSWLAYSATVSGVSHEGCLSPIRCMAAAVHSMTDSRNPLQALSYNLARAMSNGLLLHRGSTEDVLGTKAVVYD